MKNTTKSNITGRLWACLCRLVGCLQDFSIEVDKQINRLAREIAGSNRRSAENKALKQLESISDSFDVKIEMTPFGRKVTVEAKGVKFNQSNTKVSHGVRHERN